MNYVATNPVAWPSSLWVETANPADDNPPLAADVTVDVVVVGAGFTGLSAALHIAKTGARVVVLDACEVGWGASGRNGGQVNPMLPFNSPDDLRRHVGDTYFERLTAASLNSADELFSLIEEHQIECQARQKGWLRVNHNSRARRKSERDLQEWNQFGANMSLLEGTELEKLTGTSAYASGTLVPRGGAVQPLMLARGLAHLCKQTGVHIHGSSEITSMKRHEGKWRVTTAKATVTADWVIVGTNGYSGALIPKLAESVVKLTPVQIATDPLPEEQIKDILPGQQTISDSRRIIMYARREPDNRMVYGGLGQVDRAGNITGYDWLISDAERVFPQLKGANWAHRWGGNIAITQDHLPHLHEPEKGLLIGLGYNGRGVAMSNVMGKVLAERVSGKAPEFLDFPTTQIAGYPFHRFARLGVGTVARVMRFMDWVETSSSRKPHTSRD